jgi:hypothetical protein
LEILQKSVQAVQRNIAALALYIAVIACSSAFSWILYDHLGLPDKTSYPKVAYLIITLCVDAVLGVAAAFAQAVVFSRFAKDIDRPLWRMDGDMEAIRRYFPLWFALNVVVLVLKTFAFSLPAIFESENSGAFARWLLLAAVVTYIPLGAAMMFHKGSSWREFAETLAPYRRQFPKVLMLCCINGVLFMMMLSLLPDAMDKPLARVAIDVVSSYFDCVIFCAAWLICILDRQNPVEDDFEF